MVGVMTKASGRPSDETPPPDGLQMVPASWTNVTFEEFATDRATFFINNRDTLWNPWVDEVLDAAARAGGVVSERHLLGPGPIMSHEREQDLYFESAARFAADSARHRQDLRRYEPGREYARLSLLEQESLLARNVAALADKKANSAHGGESESQLTVRRADRIIKIAELVAAAESRISELVAVVGDREDVVDAEGRLPRDRRELMLSRYKWDRQRRVRELRAQMPGLRSSATDPLSASGHSKLWPVFKHAEQELGMLLAVPPLTADDMCSECQNPISRHSAVKQSLFTPCPAWSLINHPRRRGSRHHS